MVAAHINYLAVLVAAVLGHFLGALWYSPFMFGKLWMKHSGIDASKIEELKKQGLKKTYLAAFAGNLLMAWVLAYVVDYGLAETWSKGVCRASACWLGFVVPVQLGAVLWEGKPWALYGINVSYYLVSMSVMGAVLAAWA